MPQLPRYMSCHIIFGWNSSNPNFIGERWGSPKSNVEYTSITDILPSDPLKKHRSVEILMASGLCFPCVLIYSPGSNIGNLHFLWKVPEECDPAVVFERSQPVNKTWSLSYSITHVPCKLHCLRNLVKSLHVPSHLPFTTSTGNCSGVSRIWRREVLSQSWTQNFSHAPKTLTTPLVNRLYTKCTRMRVPEQRN